MKQILFSTLSLIILFSVLSSCKDESMMNSDSETAEFTAIIEESSSTTRTELNGNVVEWNEDDRIKIYSGALSSEFVVEKIENSKLEATFEGKTPEGILSSAIYPSSASKEENTVSIPTIQYYKENTPDNGTMPMYAIINDESKPLNFRNLCGIVKLQLTGDVTVKTISLTSTDEISGDAKIAQDNSEPTLTLSNAQKSVTLDCGNGVALSSTVTAFYLVAAPVSSQSFTITITTIDNKTMTKTTSTSENNQIRRNMIITMPTIAFAEDLIDIKYTSNEYEIYTAKGMQAFADLVNGNSNSTNAKTENIAHRFGERNTAINGRLMKDIDLNDLKQSNGWTPIGSFISGAETQTQAYTGDFDGNNNTISNLTINKPLSIYQGLFGITVGSDLININLQNVNINSAGYSAALVGGHWNTSVSEIRSCRVSGTIRGQGRHLGGIAGISRKSKISDCHNSASVTNEDIIAGGIVGYSENTTILASTNSGSITANANLGGIVGDNNESLNLVACYNTGSISSTGDHLGGLIGLARNIKIYACYNSGTIISERTSAGSIVGRLYEGTGVFYNTFRTTKHGSVPEINHGTTILGTIPTYTPSISSAINEMNEGISLWNQENIDNKCTHRFDDSGLLVK